MTTADRTTARLVELATTLSLADLSDETRTAAKARVLSAIAASLAAFDVEPVRIARKLAQPVAAGPQATIFGSLHRCAPDMAAFVNSAMVRSLDMSDSYVMAAVSHPADAFPAVLAAAEAQGASGADLLLATAIAYEAQCRFVEVVPYNHHGWDQTPVVALGAALGCGRVLGLTREQIAHAISLAVAPNLALNQTRTGTLSMWKGMAGPQGARAGVFAAYLASAGMTGPDGVFEGKFGLWRQMMGGEAFDLPIPARFDDHTFAVRQTMIKSFPIRFNCHVPVFAAQKLRAAIDVKQIETLKIEAVRQAFERWTDVPEVWKPQTRETADHSLPCTVAMALLDGTITPETMRRERYKDDDVLALMDRCSVELPDELAAIAPAVRSCRLTATLRGGEAVVAEYRRSLEDDTSDPGWTQAVDKLEALTRERLSAGARQALVERIGKLEGEPDLRDLVRLTEITGRRDA
ncbi:MAG TPA: MmgE/PrpD family protein [Burkholderiales bacterium]|nr:MmgE/PrpD family protein [Burkholderiales bacterium]